MTPGRPWGSAIATFLVVLALGPPIGGIVFTLAMALSPALTGMPVTDGYDLDGIAAMVLFVGLFAIPFSYLIGGIQAAVTGLAFAAYGWWRGRPPFWFAAMVAGVVFAGALVSGVGEETELAVQMLLVHVIPALLCWLVIRNFWVDREA